MAIDWEAFKSGKRPVTTRKGLPAKYGMRINNEHCHVVIVTTEYGDVAYMYDDHGRELSQFDLDLIQEEEVIEITTYANVYSNGYVYGGFLRYNDAKNSAHDGCLATVKFTTRIQGDKVTITGGTDGR